MFINGVYLNDVLHQFSRIDSYKGIDVLISNQASKTIVEKLQNDYETHGSNGYVIWGNKWPSSILTLNDEDRRNYYKDLCISNASKELLFFRNIELDLYTEDILIIYSLNNITSSNVNYVLNELVRKNKKEQLQIIVILEMFIYNNYKLSSYIHPELGLLIL